MIGFAGLHDMLVSHDLDFSL